jgi:hypothetical protein
LTIDRRVILFCIEKILVVEADGMLQFFANQLS